MILDVRENNSIGGIGGYLDGYVNWSLGDYLEWSDNNIKIWCEDGIDVSGLLEKIVIVK